MNGNAERWAVSGERSLWMVDVAVVQCSAAVDGAQVEIDNTFIPVHGLIALQVSTVMRSCR